MATRPLDPASERRLRAGDSRFRARVPARAQLVYRASALICFPAAVILLAVDGRTPTLRPLALVLTVGLFLLSDRLEIPVGSGWTAPTQLALVPMVLLLPPAWTPFLVVCCLVAPVLVPWVEPEFSLERLAVRIGDAAYAFGPALVLLAAGLNGFSWSHWPIYLATVAAQFLVDICWGIGRTSLADGASSVNAREVGWLYLTDLCFSCIGLLIASAAATSGVALIAMALPVLLLLSMFARERKQRLEQSLELSTAYRGTAELLGDVIEDDDAYTGMHTKQVVDLSVAVADRMHVDAATRRMVEYGALLHDVGKLRVPNVIIRKEGKLDDAEWEVMREHTVAGEEMLSLVGGQLADVGRVVRASHEKYDGSGYPDGLSGEAIPMESRIIAACDAWNAMTTTRSYRKALSFEVASAEMVRCAGTHFDPTVVRALLKEVADENYVQPEQTQAPIPLPVA